MWISKKLAVDPKTENTRADVGKTTLAETEIAVYANGERRGLPVFGPAGFRWRPSAGDEVLVLKTGGEDELIVAGAKSDAPDKPGDLELCSPGGALVSVKNSGEITLQSSGGHSLSVTKNEIRAQMKSGARVTFTDNGFFIAGIGGKIEVTPDGVALTGIVTANGYTVLTNEG